MNVAGAEFSASNAGDFTESPAGERGSSREAGIYAVFLKQENSGPALPTEAQVLANAEATRAVLMSIPFPMVPGVRYIDRSPTFTFADVELAWNGAALGGYRAEARNQFTSVPNGQVVRTSDLLTVAFINPCAPGLRVDNYRVQASKTLLVFGSSSINFSVPRPAGGLCCVFDSVRWELSPGFYTRESACSVAEIRAAGGGEGRVVVGRSIMLGPPSLYIGGANVRNLLRDSNPPAPQWIRRMYAPNVPHVPTGSSSNWPPTEPASCCNLA